MANPSKRKPWAVELKPPGMDKWYAIEAFGDEDTANAICEVDRKRDPKSEFRVRNVLADK